MYINSSHIREKWKRAYHLAKSINIATSVIKKKLTTIVLQQPSESILRGLVPLYHQYRLFSVKSDENPA
jgi:hypothetical protein